MTGLVGPFGFDAVQWKIWVVTGWKISSVMLVSVRTGFTPVQLGFGQPAVAPLTVGAAIKVAGFVANVRFPFLIALAGIAVSEVAGPSRTLFWPGAVLPRVAPGSPARTAAQRPQNSNPPPACAFLRAGTSQA